MYYPKCGFTYISNILTSDILEVGFSIENKSSYLRICVSSNGRSAVWRCTKIYLLFIPLGYFYQNNQCSSSFQLYSPLSPSVWSVNLGRMQEWRSPTLANGCSQALPQELQWFWSLWPWQSNRHAPSALRRHTHSTGFLIIGPTQSWFWLFYVNKSISSLCGSVTLLFWRYF